MDAEVKKCAVFFDGLFCFGGQGFQHVTAKAVVGIGGWHDKPSFVFSQTVSQMGEKRNGKTILMEPQSLYCVKIEQFLHIWVSKMYKEIVRFSTNRVSKKSCYLVKMTYNRLHIEREVIKWFKNGCGPRRFFCVC